MAPIYSNEQPGQPMPDSPQTPESAQKKPGPGRILLSTLAAAIGVQSNKNRERDFAQGNIYMFIAAGLIFSLVFVTGLVLVVKTVLSGMG